MTDHTLIDFAIVNQSGPLGTANAQESLDMAVAMSNFGKQVSLFFIDDGVYQLVDSIVPDKIGRKAFNKLFAALEFYDIEQLYVCQDSLFQRHLSASQLGVDVKILPHEQFASTLAKHKSVLVF